MPPTDEYTANRRPDVAELARLISLHAPYDGILPLRVADVDALRRSHTAGEVAHALQKASVCIVAQGAKSVGIGDTVYRYGAGQIAVFSIDVPVTAQLTRSERRRRTRCGCARGSRSKPPRAAATADGCSTARRCASAARSRPPRRTGRSLCCCGSSRSRRKQDRQRAHRAGREWLRNDLRGVAERTLNGLFSGRSAGTSQAA